MATSSTGDVRRVLWPVAALCALAGVVLLVLGLLGQANRPPVDLTGITPGQRVEMTEDGLSVWSRAPGTYLDTVCTADEATMLRPVAEYAVQVAGTRFYEVARSPEGLAAGSPAITCSTTDPVYAGPRADRTVATGLSGGTGIVTGSLLLLVGLVCGVLAVLAGRRRMPEGHGTIPLSRLMPPSSGTPGAHPSGGPGTAYPSGGAGTPEPPRGPRYDLPPPG